MLFRSAEEVAALLQRRDRLQLNGGGLRITFLREGAEKGLGEAEVRKLGQNESFIGPRRSARVGGTGTAPRRLGGLGGY